MKKKTSINLKCGCCGKESKCAAISDIDKKVVCGECLKYAPSHYGFMSGQELIDYIKIKKNKKWWEVWR